MIPTAYPGEFVLTEMLWTLGMIAGTIILLFSRQIFTYEMGTWILRKTGLGRWIK